MELFPAYNKSIAKIGLPWFHAIGNHDMNKDAEKDEHADETYEATFGPPSYSFNHGKAHFIILDNIIYPQSDGKSGYTGGFTEKQYNYIKNNLKLVPQDHLVILAFISHFLEWRTWSQHPGCLIS